MARRLRVAIDATVIGERLTGAGRVAKNLVASLPVVDRDAEYSALVTPVGRRHLATATIDVAVLPLRRGVELELWTLGRHARRVQADLMLTLREIVGLTNPPTILHLFEPPAYRLRQVEPWLSKRIAKDWLLHALLGGSIRRAAMVTAGAQATAAWLEQRYGIRPPVIAPGIDDKFLVGPSGRSEADPPYFLHLASGDPRDNTGVVLEAFARAEVPDAMLRLVGTPVHEAERLRNRAGSLGIEGRVLIAGWVPDEELVRLYREAIALVHLAAYESFAGLPPLEAMGVGTPVVAMKVPGVQEALEGAALLIEEPRPSAVAAALVQLAADAALRRQLSARGWERVRAMTWQATAQRFAQVIHAVARKTGGASKRRGSESPH